MTQPPPGSPGGEPQDPQQEAWQPPPTAPGGSAPTPEQAAPPLGWAPQPTQNQPWAPQPAQDQPWAPPPAQDQPWGPPYSPQPSRPSNRGKLIASAAVAVALVAGGVVTYVAMSDSKPNGASSPNQAVRSLVDDLNKSDLLGVLDDLAPGERSALANPTLDEINHLKRLKVLQQSADPKNVDGVSFSAKSLTFSDKTVTINDHVQVVQLTGGSLDISADADKVAFTHDFIAAAFPHGLPATGKQTTHIDIAEAIRQADGKPIRIATQKTGGKWYPSIFYTIADYASEQQAPTSADAIPAAGAASPEDAVKQEVDALNKGDLTRAIALLSPDELAVMHDYGGRLLRNGGSQSPSDDQVTDLQLRTTKVSGATRVLLSSVTVRNGSNTVTVKVDGNCAEVTVQGDQKRFCAAEFAAQIVAYLKNFGTAEPTAGQQQALEHLLTGLTKIGVDTTQSGGKWYVNPVRSYLDVTNAVLAGLKGNDLVELIGWLGELAN
jgi:hypothetical protein